MAGWNTCKHGFCGDCGYGGWEHHSHCDSEDLGQHQCPECEKLSTAAPVNTVQEYQMAKTKKRTKMVLDLHLSGHTNEQISTLCGTHISGVARSLKKSLAIRESQMNIEALLADWARENEERHLNRVLSERKGHMAELADGWMPDWVKIPA